MAKTVSKLVSVLLVISILFITIITEAYADTTENFSSVKIKSYLSTTFLRENGNLWTFGHNGYGLIGNGTKADKYKPYKVLDNVADFDFSSYVAYAVKKDGSLWGWGSNNSGAFKDGTNDAKLEPFKISDDVKKAFPLDGYSCIIKSDDSLWQIGGYDQSNQLLKETWIMDDAKDVWYVEGAYFALKTDDSLWTWGADLEVRLKDRKSLAQNLTPVKIMDNVKTMVYERRSMLILKNDNTLWAWGENKNGTLGNGTKEAVTKPVYITDKVTQIETTLNNSFAVKTDGSLWAWGDNDYGQLLTGGSESLSPVKIMEGVKAVDAELASVFVLKKDNTLWGWIGSYRGSLKVEPVKYLDNVVDLCFGTQSIIAVKNDGSVWGWGGNGSGELGIGTNDAQNTPVKLLDLKVPDLNGKPESTAPATPAPAQTAPAPAQKPSTPIQTPSAQIMAKPTNSSVIVDGKKVSFNAYSINGNNYFKLRDLAAVINGTSKQFEVSWDGSKNAISLMSGKSYTKVGGELGPAGDGLEKKATASASKLYFNGKEKSLIAYSIDGSNYFKLRDIGDLVKFSVTWDGKTNTISIDTKDRFN